ncbi:MAG: hypothetical protein WD490_10695 [Opitutales bacterium]
MRHLPTVGEQALRLEASVPWSRVRLLGSDSMTWMGNVSPDAFSSNYMLRIYYKFFQAPVVHVLAPELRRYQGMPLPHVYPGNQLCLFDPRCRPRQWDPWMWIADTTLRWAVMWLYYYEIWAMTGVWHGGGTHPDHQEAA